MQLDDAVDRAFDRLRANGAANRIFYGASRLGDHSFIWALLGGMKALRGGEHVQEAVRLWISLPLESAFINLGIKSLFRRRRPVLEYERPFHLRVPLTSSFPSGHATSAFMAAALLSDNDPLWPLYYAIAIVVSLSRIHVRIHHASDVLGGVVIGVALGQLVLRLFPIGT